jgi:hypothetical protein
MKKKTVKPRRREEHPEKRARDASSQPAKEAAAGHRTVKRGSRGSKRAKPAAAVA